MKKDVVFCRKYKYYFLKDKKKRCFFAKCAKKASLSARFSFKGERLVLVIHRQLGEAVVDVVS
jgi:hypothetical protein